MKILKVNVYKSKSLSYIKIFFIDGYTFKWGSQRLFKSAVPRDYYTTELTRVLKP